MKTNGRCAGWRIDEGEWMEPETQSHKYQHNSHLLQVRESYLGRLSDPCWGMRTGLENIKETRQSCTMKSEGVNGILSFCCPPPTLTVPIRLLKGWRETYTWLQQLEKWCKFRSKCQPSMGLAMFPPPGQVKKKGFIQLYFHKMHWLPRLSLLRKSKPIKHPHEARTLNK